MTSGLVGSMPSRVLRRSPGGARPLSSDSRPSLRRRTGVRAAPSGRCRTAVGYAALHARALAAPRGLRAGGDMQDELVALAGGRAALYDGARAAAAARGLGFRAALLGTEAEEGEEPALRRLPARTTVLCPLALVLADRFRGLHLADALRARALVADERAPHLGHPAMDGGCLAAVGPLCAVAPDVFLRTYGQRTQTDGSLCYSRPCPTRSRGLVPAS